MDVFYLVQTKKKKSNYSAWNYKNIRSAKEKGILSIASRSGLLIVSEHKVNEFINLLL